MPIEERWRMRRAWTADSWIEGMWKESRVWAEGGALLKMCWGDGRIEAEAVVLRAARRVVNSMIWQAKRWILNRTSLFVASRV